MDNSKKCSCPLCGQNYELEKGSTPEEHLAKGILKVYSDLQKSARSEEYPCPRCGEMKMLSGARNALSRHFDIDVCGECGNNEAMRVYNKDVLPLKEWSAVSILLASLPGFECPDYIQDENSAYSLCGNRECERSSECNISAYMADDGGLSHYDK